MALSAGETGHLADHAEHPQYVKHGATASTARPTLGSGGTAATVVLWDGSVDPDNKVSGDYWWDTTNDLWKRYDGASWVSASGTSVVVAETELGTSAATIDFASIPSTYRNLLLIVRGRGTDSSGAVALFARFNNDSGGNYEYQRLYGTLGSAAAARSTAQTEGRLGGLPAATAGANRSGYSRLWVPDYADATLHTVYRAEGGFESSTSAPINETNYGQWNSSSAVNRITLLLSAGSFAAGTVATLYGMKGA